MSAVVLNDTPPPKRGKYAHYRRLFGQLQASSANIGNQALEITLEPADKLGSIRKAFDTIARKQGYKCSQRKHPYQPNTYRFWKITI